MGKNCTDGRDEEPNLQFPHFRISAFPALYRLATDEFGNHWSTDWPTACALPASARRRLPAMAYVALPVPGPSSAEPLRMVMQTVCGLTQEDIDEWFYLQAPILAAGAAGSSAAVWAVLSPECIRVLGPEDCNATPRQMAEYADQIADVVAQTVGRDVVNTGYEFYQVVRFAPTTDEMRPDVDATRRRRRRPAANAGLPAKAGSPAAPGPKPGPAAQPLTLAEMRAIVLQEAAVSGPVRKAVKQE